LSKRSYVSLIAALALLGVTETVVAQTGGGPDHVSREPWKWTDEERVAKRLDPASIRERAAARISRAGVSSVGDPIRGQEDRFVIDGAANPELFLPYELFTALIAAIDPDLPESDRAVHRAMFERAMKGAGFRPEKVWTDLRAATGRYFAMREAVKSGAEKSSPQVRLCKARYDAIAAARKRFGGDAFDRLLYTVVAPTLSTQGPLPSERERAGLLYLSSGCP